MISALTLVMTLSMIVLTCIMVSVDSSKQTDQKGEIAQLQLAAESAISLSAHEVWSAYLALEGGQAGSVASFRAYLDGIGVHSEAALLAEAEANAAEGVDSVAVGGANTGDILNLLTFSQDQFSRDRLGGMSVDALRLTRRDQAGATQLFFESTVSARKGSAADKVSLQESVQQAFVIEGAEWPGLNYALLANNVNCIMCHAEIDSAERVYNEDPLLNGSFPRSRIGTMEELMLRSSADSTLAGTLYIRGRALQKDGTPITDWSAQTLKAFEFDDNGNMVEDMWGDGNLVDLVPTDPNDPQPLANLYLDYDQEADSMVDGYLPESFPPPFPDTGGFDPATGAELTEDAGNREVDMGEYAQIAGAADGALAGGTIHVTAPGDVVETATDLDTALGAGNVASLGPDTSGHVVLTGTAADPILLNGMIAINGDVVIQGVVKGEGSIYATGNVYVPGDLTYADGTTATGGRTFGVSDDGTVNALAIASGGSVMVGDLFYKKPKRNSDVGSVTGFTTGEFGFVMSELALFNRNEWSKTQPVLQGAGEDSNNPATWTAVNPNYGGADYMPRYYVFTEGGKIPIYNKGLYFNPTTGSWVGKEHPDSWDSSMLTMVDHGDTSSPLLFDDSGKAVAAVKVLTAGDAWMTDDILREMMQRSLAAHTDGEPQRLDGLLYSNNSIFGIVGKSGKMRGRLIVNGAILAPDIGLLIPGDGHSAGLSLQFDERTSHHLTLKSEENITLRRTLWVARPSVH
jgi:hypothetical protein